MMNPDYYMERADEREGALVDALHKARSQRDLWQKIAADLYTVGCHSRDCSWFENIATCDCTYQYAVDAYEKAARGG